MLALLERHSKSPRAFLGIPADELAAAAYGVRRPSHSMLVATRRSLGALVELGLVERIADTSARVLGTAAAWPPSHYRQAPTPRRMLRFSVIPLGRPAAV